MTDAPTDLGWWAISGDALLDMLRRCHDGEDPDLVYAEEYANSDHDVPDQPNPGETTDNSPEAMRERRPGQQCDCPTLRNVGAGWYCGIHGYQDTGADT